MRDWQAYALAAFAVAAGQVLKIGRKIEAGKPVTWRDIAVLCTLLPAFGALGGAAALHFQWPAWTILLAGICAGWTGIGTIRVILRMLPTLLPAPLARLLGGTSEPTP
ncbi:hypothetical protein ASE95_02755 [Sphingomonas sp. Leaf231]|uniref:hypothetical protein n=1 Tax=Sphingomonas sp. Leaf231 TaxID=1736301 RepID=UPI0006F3AA2D|nr:hypothetical protein [Sphingomonas sp. Leaf231]KQN93843.1 hypothetical protein ASE95_02755 [Sphingomonas sp. Leaf231]